LALKYSLMQDFFEDPASAGGPFTVAYDFLGAIPLGEKFAFETSFYLRSIMNDHNGLYATPLGNAIGGDFSGRYFETQVPFVGMVDAALAYDWLAAARLDARVKLSP
ncbi:MAG: hypothetical protein II613_05210, partial [Bacteroidales bacterium]|nr:hypothetical protein [Bacteroidales bacterium]